MADALAGRLAAIRERAEQLTASHADEDCDGPDPCTGHDALRMADGYDALLKLADEWDSPFPDRRAARVRQAITRALTGGSHD